jgi:hypothetical protein
MYHQPNQNYHEITNKAAKRKPKNYKRNFNQKENHVDIHGLRIRTIKTQSCKLTFFNFSYLFINYKPVLMFSISNLSNSNQIAI